MIYPIEKVFSYGRKFIFNRVEIIFHLDEKSFSALEKLLEMQKAGIQCLK